VRSRIFAPVVNVYVLIVTSPSAKRKSTEGPLLWPSRGLATPPPSQRADEIIEKLPSKPGIITKTGTALLGTGLAAAAISNELYVVNEETILLIGSIIVFTYIGKVPPP